VNRGPPQQTWVAFATLASRGQSFLACPRELVLKNCEIGLTTLLIARLIVRPEE